MEMDTKYLKPNKPTLDKCIMTEATKRFVYKLVQSRRL